MKELNLFEKTMTVKEVAETLGVSTDTVKNCIRRIMPNKMQNGKTTYLSEEEVAYISKELKTNAKVTEQLTYEAASQVKNTTTELEVIGNALAAFKDLQELYNRKEAEYKAIIAQKDSQLLEQKPLVDGYQTFLASHNSFSMQEASAMLKDSNGKSPYGRNSLIDKLRSENIFLPKPKSAIPYREYIDRGYFEVKTSVHNGISHDSTLVFPRGLDYLAKKLGLIIEYKAAA